MHFLVGILSRAESADQAREQALAFADTLVERDEFDYYDLDSGRWARGGHTGHSP